ncbi:MAG: hypothetical protein VYE73_10010 [Acidobacteriota bacterium]|nr:hypothetical protein [Acidobacteriota bacterium]
MPIPLVWTAAGLTVFDSASMELQKLTSVDPATCGGLIVGARITADDKTLRRYERRLHRILKDLQAEADSPAPDDETRLMVLAYFPVPADQTS